MQNVKQLFLSVAREVLEVTKTGEVPEHTRTSSGVYVDFAVGVCALSYPCGVRFANNPESLAPWLTEKFQQWPKFSGNYRYPVPGHGYYSPISAFEWATHKAKWSPSHPYGALRRELLQFLIDELEKELNTEGL